jgi:hypothetical protein
MQLKGGGEWGSGGGAASPSASPWDVWAARAACAAGPATRFIGTAAVPATRLTTAGRSRISSRSEMCTKVVEEAAALREAGGSLSSSSST